MSKEIDLSSLSLDWRLAVQRLAKDVRDDFWPDPLGYRDILGTADTVEARIGSLVKLYRPRTGTSFHVPKANLTIRDSIHLTPLDRLVYQALVDRIAVEADSKLLPTVYSHRVRGPAAKYIFHSGVQQWKAFRDAVKEEILKGSGSFLVVTDVAQYFETVKLKHLRRQLDQLLSGWPDLGACVGALMICLSTWSPYDGYGLVQNVDASSLLGNILLDYVDKMMEREGYPILRYMDDIRIVVQSEADARRALIRLVTHLRQIGLGLNSAKTSIVFPDSDSMKTHLVTEDPEVAQIEEAIGKKQRAAVQGVVPTLFAKAEAFVEAGDTKERLFRFCLNRIATLRAYSNLELPPAESITDAVLRLLVSQPAETGTFSRYLETAHLNAEHLAEIERLLVSEERCVYPWQNFQLWRLASQRKVHSPVLLRRAHAVMRADRANPEAGAAALYLGASGEYQDRQAVKHNIGGAPPASLVRRCMQIAIQELHKAERTPVYSSLAADDPQALILGQHLESAAEPIYVDNPPPIGLDELPDAMPSMYA